MTVSINSVVISGRLVRDPETRATQGGSTVARFTVAVQRDFANKQTGQRDADFLDCVAFGKTGEFVARYFTKGAAIGVVGRIQTRSYTDKSGGNRKAVEIEADRVSFGDGKSKAEPEPPEYYEPAARKDEVVAAPEADFAVIDDDKDLPF